MDKPFVLLILILFCACWSVSLADYDDGFITEGEYEYGVDWFSFDPPLIVEGGGADWIEIRDYGCLEVRYTSTPLSNSGGILNILLVDESELLYLGGLTGEIILGKDAEAVLKGGSIDHITSRQFVNGEDDEHIDLYCREGWEWLYDSPDVIGGITGNWWDGTAFNIDFIHDYDYDPAWQNINIITPEPATLVLFGIGGLLLRRKR